MQARCHQSDYRIATMMTTCFGVRKILNLVLKPGTVRKSRGMSLGSCCQIRLLVVGDDKW